MQSLKRYTPNWIVVFLITVVVFFLFILSFYRLEIDGDIIGSLPENDPVISDATHVMRFHPMQDQVIIDIGLEEVEPDVLVEAGHFVEQRLKESGLFDTVGVEQFGHLIPELIDIVTESLPWIFSEKQIEEQIAPLLEPEWIAEKLDENLLQLYQIDSIGRAATLSKDPLGFGNIVLARLANLAPTKNSIIYKGKLLSSDQKHLLILAKPIKLGTDTSVGQKIASTIERISHEMHQHFSQKGYHIDLIPMGAYRAAIDNETAARGDVQKAIFFSTLGIAVLLFFSFPRPWLGLLALLPAVVGTVVALFVYSLFFDTISLLTIGFGGAIIAISVDHGIAFMLFMDRPDESNAGKAAQEVRSVGFLAALTTIGAFFSLSFSGFPILAQAGLFAGMGIGFSFIFVHWIFPLMIPAMAPAKRKNVMPLQTIVDGFALKGEKYKLVIALLVGFVMLFFIKVDFQIDLRAMNTISDNTRAAETRIEENWGNIFSKVFLMLEEKSLGALQQTSDVVLSALEKEMALQSVSSTFLPSMIFPGKNRMAENFQAWKAFWNERRKDDLKKTLTDNCIRLGFTPDAFDPFFQILNQQSYTFHEIPEKFHDILGISYDPKRSIWVQFSTLLPGNAYTAEDFFSRVAIIENSTIFDPCFFAQKLGKILSDTFLKMLIIVGCSALILLLIFFADLMLTIIAVLPIIFAFICTLGTMQLIGHPLGIPALMLAIVVIGMGVDYSIFFIRSYQRYRDKMHPFVGLFRMAVFLASLSSLIGFGVLSFADHALLKSAGLPSFLGIAYAMIGTFTLLPPILGYLFSNQKTGNSDR
jgi:uncharacterized protein